MKSTAKANKQLGVKVSIITLVMNVALSALKLVAGILGHSAAMISDAVHSLSDVFSTVIVIIGIKVSGKPADENHRFGHHRFESIASIILVFMLLVTGIGIGWAGLQKILTAEQSSLVVPGLIALIAAVVSIVVKEGMYWYTRWAAKKTGSDALMADAWHHRSDALSSVGSFIGIFGAMLGFPILDPLAALVICFFIVKAAVDIFMSAMKKLVDESCDGEMVEIIGNTTLRVEGVVGLKDIRTRKFGNGAYVEIEAYGAHDQTLSESHIIAEQIHDEVENLDLGIHHCVVCMVPDSLRR